MLLVRSRDTSSAGMEFSGGILRRRLLILILALAIPGAVLLGYSFHSCSSIEQQLAMQVALARSEAPLIAAQIPHFSEHAIPNGLNVTDFLQGMGVARDTVLAVVDAARPVYDLARLRAGNQMVVVRTVAGDLLSLRYQIDPDRMLWVFLQGDEFQAEIKEIPSTVETVRVEGEIRDSLFNAVEDAGERAELAIRLSEIFGWDLDFYTDPRKATRSASSSRSAPTPTASPLRTENYSPPNTTMPACLTRPCSSATPAAARRITRPTASRCRKRFFVRRSSSARPSPRTSAGAVFIPS